MVVFDAEYRFARRAAFTYGRRLGLTRSTIRRTVRAGIAHGHEWSQIRAALSMTAMGW